MTDDKHKEYLGIGTVFCLFFLIATMNLTHSSLWLDEIVEFNYSSAPISEMYSLIIKTFQPPLYNIIMHFWLLISEREWWFRFFGVITGIFANIGLYKTIKFLYNWKIACLSVAGLSFIYRWIYYLQECSEYSLMLCFLFWAIYYWFRCYKCENDNISNAIKLIIFCVLSMYTQYGAFFVVLFLLLSYGLKVLSSKNKKQVKKIVILYLIGLLGGTSVICFFCQKANGITGDQ